MVRADKYGRGSAVANGEGFVDLSSGDTFAAVEDQLKRRVADRFDNLTLGISAIIGSKRNASELAKHLASGEGEEVHKFAAKNIGVLFARGRLGVSHFDKKAKDETREKPMILRVFAAFVFAESPFVATITIKPADSGLRLYAIEALDIMRDERPEVHLAAKPRQFKTTRLLLADRISYYVGDVNRTNPKFIGRDEPFSIERTVELLEEMMREFNVAIKSSSANHPAPVLSIIVPSYNMEQYLPKCLGSLVVAPELMEKLEVLVVNDGSKDRTSEIAHEFEAKWPGTFKVIDKENGNYGSCINAALPVATGTWVKVLDADDWFDSVAFCHYVKFLVGLERTEPDVDLVVSDFHHVDSGGNKLKLFDYSFMDDQGFSISSFNAVQATRLWMHAVAFRTERVRQLGYRQSEGLSYTDQEWIAIPMENVRVAVHFKEAVYQYRVDREGQTCDLSVYLKNLWQQVKVTEGLVKRFGLVGKELRAPNKDCIRQLIEFRVRMLYQYYFQDRTKYCPRNGLKALDRLLKELMPELYSSLECMYLSERVRFHCVREWRRNGHDGTLKFFAYDTYHKIAVFLSRRTAWLK